MGFKKKLKNKLKGIIKSYEDGSELGEYAKGRLANTKMILDIVKKMDYIPCCKSDSEQLCHLCNKPLKEGVSLDYCTNLYCIKERA